MVTELLYRPLTNFTRKNSFFKLLTNWRLFWWCTVNYKFMFHNNVSMLIFMLLMHSGTLFWITWDSINQSPYYRLLSTLSFQTVSNSEKMNPNFCRILQNSTFNLWPGVGRDHGNPPLLRNDQPNHSSATEMTQPIYKQIYMLSRPNQVATKLANKVIFLELNCFT
jgi:hypothetical protein